MTSPWRCAGARAGADTIAANGGPKRGAQARPLWDRAVGLAALDPRRPLSPALRPNQVNGLASARTALGRFLEPSILDENKKTEAPSMAEEQHPEQSIETIALWLLARVWPFCWLVQG